MWQKTKFNMEYFEIPEFSLVLKVEKNGTHFRAAISNTRNFGSIFYKDFESIDEAKIFLESVSLFDLLKELRGKE